MPKTLPEKKPSDWFTDWCISQHFCRHVGRYTGWHIGWVSTNISIDMSTDMVINTWLTSRPIAPTSTQPRGAQIMQDLLFQGQFTCWNFTLKSLQLVGGDVNKPTMQNTFRSRAWNNYWAGAGHIVRSNVILLGHRHFWPDKFNAS